MPLIGRGAELIESIFVDWKDPNSKHVTAEKIKKQQYDYFEGWSNRPVGIFPEGTCTNGKVLLPFKLGAFLNLLPV